MQYDDFVASDNVMSEPDRIGYQALKLEQATMEDGLTGYTCSIPEKRKKAEIINLLEHAGAKNIQLSEGSSSLFRRAAYRLTFFWEGMPVSITYVTLPLKTAATETKVRQSKRQALYHLKVMIQLELEKRHFQPQLVAFSSYMLLDGNRDVSTYIKTHTPLIIEGNSDER